MLYYLFKCVSSITCSFTKGAWMTETGLRHAGTMAWSEAQQAYLKQRVISGAAACLLSWIAPPDDCIMGGGTSRHVHCVGERAVQHALGHRELGVGGAGKVAAAGQRLQHVVDERSGRL